MVVSSQCWPGNNGFMLLLLEHLFSYCSPRSGLTVGHSEMTWSSLNSGMSRRTTFILTIGLCVLGIVSLTYFTSVENLNITKLAYHTFSKLRFNGIMKTMKSAGNISDNDTSKDEQSTISTPQFLTIRQGTSSITSTIANTTIYPKINQANSSNATITKLPANATTMTFNTTLVVYCKDSPFIECQPPIQLPTSDKTFRVVMMRRPTWMPTSCYTLGGCTTQQCTFTDNAVTNDTDVVVVYSVGLNEGFPIPQRWPHQLYAVATWESPFNTHASYLHDASSVWNKRINMTITYRADADVFVPYNRLRFNPQPLEKRPNYYEMAKNKTKFAAWIVSHCGTESYREKYVKEMQNYVEVDIFGGCGQPCRQGDFDCYKQLNNYKFYLAFENSLCTDYITEKFFKVFSSDIHVIPVARGGADYDKYFPNFTYINTAHFKTAKDLAQHLKNLASDLNTYSKYLEYKDLYEKIGDLADMPCRTCEFLQSHRRLTPKVYNLKSWVGDGHCRSPGEVHDIT